MAVRINRKICDNADACGGIEVCPNGAFFWDADKQLLCTDDDKCTSCGQCEDACPIGAIICAADGEALKRIEAEIAADERTLDELMVERYGAMHVDESMQIDDADIKAFVKKSAGIVLIEQNKESTIQCLLHSIPVSQIQAKCEYKFAYKKTFVDEDTEGEFPRILIFNNKAQAGMVEGYFDDAQIEDLVEKINKVL